MKVFHKIISAAACVSLSGILLAQTGAPASANPQDQSKPATAAPQTATPAAPPLTPTQRRGQPQAKTQEEFAAYKAATGQVDLAAAQTAADQFAEQYPQSDLRTVLYSQLLQKYYNGGQTAKVIDTGHKILAVEPDDTVALVMTATAIAESARDTDLDQDQKYAEAMKDAENAVKNIDVGLAVPPTMPAEQVAAAKRELVSMADAAMGYIEINRKNYGLSEQHFKDAIAANPENPDPTNYLRLAVSQDNQKKYAEALASASKAQQLGEQQNNPQIVSIAKNEIDRLNKLIAAAPKPAAATPPKQ